MLRRVTGASVAGLLMVSVSIAGHAHMGSGSRVVIAPAESERGFASAAAPARVAASATTRSSAVSVPGVVDHKGKIVTNSKTYAIYWGPPTDFPADLRPGVKALLSGLNRSAYLATIDQYMRGKTASTTHVRSFADPSRPPTVDPTPQVVLAEVRKVLRRAEVRPDPNAVYLVFTSNLPAVDYCAWHASGDIAGVTTQIALVPNTSSSASCYVTKDFAGVANYSFGTRSMADNAAHELLEAMTDALPGTAWVDANFEEIGDKCDFVYAAPVALNGSGNVWQLQSQWSNRANACIQVGVVSQSPLPARPPRSPGSHRQPGSPHSSGSRHSSTK